MKQVSPDASEAPMAKSDKNNPSGDNSVQGGFRTIVSLKAPYLERDGAKYQLGRACRFPLKSISAAAPSLSTCFRPSKKPCTKRGVSADQQKPEDVML